MSTSTRTTYVAFDDEPADRVSRVSVDADGMLSIDLGLSGRYTASITAMLGATHAERLTEQLLAALPAEAVGRLTKSRRVSEQAGRLDSIASALRIAESMEHPDNVAMFVRRACEELDQLLTSHGLEKS